MPKFIKATSFAVLLTALNSFSQVEPCQDYTCDSLAVRAILDSNGLSELPVEAVARRTGMDGRIGSLTRMPPVITMARLGQYSATILRQIWRPVASGKTTRAGACTRRDLMAQLLAKGQRSSSSMITASLGLMLRVS